MTDELQDKSKLIDRLAKHLQTSTTDGLVESCLDEAHHLVLGLVGTRQVPKPIHERALIECAADLYWRREARAGLASFDGIDGTTETVHIRRDPLDGARDILGPWLGVGIA